MPGTTLEFFVVLDPEGTSHISIPAQGLREGTLSEVESSSERAAFLLAVAGARLEATLASSGASESCTFSQRGFEFPCALEPMQEDAFNLAQSMRRPQTPRAPFPYAVEDVAFDNDADGVHLAGTLTIPPGEGPHPAALLISGSGAQDRDETIMGHKPFLVLADHLSRQGIAVLRVDDRGVGGSSGSVSESTGADFAQDAAAGLAMLRAHARIDPDRVGVIGHSEGGVVGPRVASTDAKVAFVVMMAGTGVPGDQVIRKQAVELVKASGASESQVEATRVQQDTTIDAILAAKTLDDARAAVPANVAAGISPWFMDFVRYDPAPALKAVRCPVLVLQGDLDLQVLPDQNLPAIRSALRGNDQVKVVQFPGLNHLFQQAKTGLPAEYAAIEQTLAPEVLSTMSEWVSEVVAP
ncbi:MAG: alpha/beta fold hydrolase [Nannocystaceae bacterium]|nr:alpha/beta fold hydrolase [Nannocystaceae bacterium]